MDFIPYQPARLPEKESQQRGEAFYAHLDARRSVRDFSTDPVPKAFIDTAIRAASTAPSGAHMQPWTFAAIANPALKKKIRLAAEAEEKESYESRMSDEWLARLAPLGTDWHKPYLETVPWIVVLFAQRYGFDANGEKIKHYYVTESCGIAAGMFIAALHQMGLSTLTHTPSPMGFLGDILERPPNEKAMILFPVGYPAPEATVPDLDRRPLEAVSKFYL